MTAAPTEDDLLQTFVPDGDVPLAVRIHRPPGAGTNRQPAVVVMGSWLTVKEQMADTYAAALAEQGFTAVTFDFAGFGASGGVLRQAEIPVRKIRNLAAVVDFMRTLSVVDPGKLAVLAVCASAQYALGALARGLPVGSFVSVAGWFHDLATVAPFYGGGDGVAERLRRSTIASRTFAESGDLSLVPAYGPGDDTAGMSMEMDYYASPERGNVPQWRNEMSEMSWAHWLQYDAFAAAEGVRVPPCSCTATTPYFQTTSGDWPTNSASSRRCRGPMARRPTSTTNASRLTTPSPQPSTTSRTSGRSPHDGQRRRVPGHPPLLPSR